MGRILVQNRRPVVPNVAYMTITDTTIAAWNGFPESDTQSMVIGGWIRERVRSSAYPNPFSKGSFQKRGVQSSVSPDRRIYSALNKSLTSTNNSASSKITAKGWLHVVLFVSRAGVIRTYVNGALNGATTISGFSAGEHWTSAEDPAVHGILTAPCTAALAVCNLIFASTNDANRTLATDDQIRRLYETGAIPPDVIYWPMDEGAGSGAGTCKAYVNGVNVPALDGNLSANSWVADSPFN